MTTFCRIVLTVVSCTVDQPAPRPSPAEAAAVLTASVPPAAPTWRLDSLTDGFRVPGEMGGTFIPPPQYDPHWPFSGTFAPTWSPTLTRLDGSSVFAPPNVYGAPAYYAADPFVLVTGGYDRATNTYYPAGAFGHGGPRHVRQPMNRPGTPRAVQTAGPATTGGGAGRPLPTVGRSGPAAPSREAVRRGPGERR